MDPGTSKQGGKQHGPSRHRQLEQTPSIQPFEGLIISALSRDYLSEGLKAPEDQKPYDTKHVPESSAGTEEELPTQSEKREWLRYNRMDRKCLILEVLVVSIVVIGIILGTVLGTVLSARAHHSASIRDSSPVFIPSADSVPIGATFNASFSVGASCTGIGSCDASDPRRRYTTGVSQNLYGSGIDGQAWSCRTCWRLTTFPGVTNSSSIVVTVVTDCPPAEENGLCLMKTLEDKNVYRMNVNFNLCPESGAPKHLLGNQELGLGEAVRVNC